MCSFLSGYYTVPGLDYQYWIILSAGALATAIAGLNRTASLLFVLAAVLAGSYVGNGNSSFDTHGGMQDFRGGVWRCRVNTTTTRGAIVETQEDGYVWCSSREMALSVSRGDSVVVLGAMTDGFMQVYAFEASRSQTVQNRLRRRIATVLRRRIPSINTSSLASALIAGERGYIPYSIRELFRRTGISHILAVSGLHVGFICAAVLLMLRGIAGRTWSSTVLTILLMVFYVFVTGARASTVRAGVMGGILLLGFQIRGRIPDILFVWSVAVLTILAVSGRAVLDDTGAQMSFAAVLSLIVLGRSFRIRFGKPVSVLYAGTVVTLALAPLVSRIYGSISPIAPVATLISLPFMLSVILLGSLSLTFGVIASGASVLAEWTVFIWLKMLHLLDFGSISYKEWMLYVWFAAILLLLLISRRGGYFRRFR